MGPVGPSNFHVKPSHERSHSQEGGHGHLHGLRSSENGVKLRTFLVGRFSIYHHLGSMWHPYFKGLKSHETCCNWDKVGYIVGCMDITVKFHVDVGKCTQSKNFSFFGGVTFQSLHVSVSDLNLLGCINDDKLNINEYIHVISPDVLGDNLLPQKRWIFISCELPPLR